MAPARTFVEDLSDLQERTQAGLAQVEARLFEAVATADPFVREAAGYLAAAGGKRFRPTLVLLSGYTGGPDERRLVDASVAVELTHLSTLYHDDVIDEAELRRGMRSANARFDNKIAVLTGDYLFACASQVVARLGAEATAILAGAVARLVQGEIRDVRGPAQGEDPVAHYLGVLEDKTGALIAAACRLGAHLGGAPPEVVQALSDYGERVGLAFQLADDLLDITSEHAVSGKQPGGDLRAGVRTLPVLYLLRDGGPDAARLATLLAEPSDGALTEALTILRRSPALAQARATARREADRARTALTTLPPCPARAALEDLVTHVVDRDT